MYGINQAASNGVRDIHPKHVHLPLPPTLQCWWFYFYIKDIFEMSLLCLRWQAIINHIHQCPIGSGFVFHITRNVQRIWKSLEYLWLELLCCCANISQSNAVPDSNISWINVLYWLVVWACLLLMMIPWSTSFQATEFQNWSRYACNFG